MKKLLVLLLAVAMVVGLFAGCSKSSDSSTTSEASESVAEETKEEETPAEDVAEEEPADEAGEDEAEAEAEEPAETETESEGTVSELPRTETLYYGGLQYGNVNSYNPIGVNQNNAFLGGGRNLLEETLYMYNFMDGQLYPLLADGDYEWNDDMSEMTVKIKEAAHFSDGTPVTANDVVRTWDISVEISNAWGTSYSPYIEAVEAVDDQTILIKCALNDEGQPKNPLMVYEYLANMAVASADWIDTVVERNGGDATGILNDPADDAVMSGPYLKYYDDDQKLIIIRDDNYWGQDASMWGTLPAPKYIAHNIYSGNDATEAALRAGDVDVDQQFLPNVQNLWLDDGLDISTYYDEAPYHVSLSMPTCWFNFNMPIIAENPALRKAIVMATDFETIIANAMTGQSPTFNEVPRSLMNPTDGEQALYNQSELADLQAELAGGDIEGANAVLDEAGLVDTDGDGIREWNGENIHLNIVCPDGWSDWQAAIQVVAAAGDNIGIIIDAEYPTWDVMQGVFTDGTQTEYSMFMYTATASAPSAPWQRYRTTLSSEFVGIQNNWSGNWGQYSNEEVDELIAAIPLMTDEEEIKAAYTRLNEIYLTDLPSFALMYRPQVFYIVYEGVWTNYPSSDDGRNIPPAICCDGYGVAALFELELAE